MSDASRKQRRHGRVSFSRLRDDVIARIKDLDAPSGRHDGPTLEASLVALGRNVIAALDLLRQNGARAEGALAELRAALHAKAVDPTVVGEGAMGAGIGDILRAEIDAHCDSVATRVYSTVARKVGALERELVRIDGVLDEWRAIKSSVDSFRDDADDAIPVELHTTLSRRLDGFCIAVLEVPTVVMEPPELRLDNLEADLGRVDDLARLFAPPAVKVADVDVLTSPWSLPEDAANMKLYLGVQLGGRYRPDEITHVLEWLAAATRVDAFLRIFGGAPVPLHVGLSCDAEAISVLVHLEVPPHAGRALEVVVKGISVAGQKVGGFPRTTLLRGIECNREACPAAKFMVPRSPCVTLCGDLIAPSWSADAETLRFSSYGHQLPPEVAFPPNMQWAACAGGDHTTIVLAAERQFAIYALEPDYAADNWRVRWSQSSHPECCHGVAALPRQGLLVAVCADVRESMLNVYHLADGRVHRKLSAGARLQPYMAADALSGSVFGNVLVDTASGYCGLQVRQWAVSAESGTSGVVVAAAGINSCPYRPLTVMPPAPGKRVAHLVAGTFVNGELLVIALPELRLVHRHRLSKMRVTGLAADPWGRALVVCDGNAIRVLPWPLRGMEELA